jgi:hypothetical protein
MSVIGTAMMTIAATISSQRLPDLSLAWPIMP